MLNTSGAHCLHKELWLRTLLIGFPDTCFLTFLEMSIAVWLRLRAHTLRFGTATWNSSSSPTCDLCEADDDVQDENMFSFTARSDPSDGFSPQEVRSQFHGQDPRVCLLYYTRKTTNSISELVLICEQASSQYSFLKASSW